MNIKWNWNWRAQWSSWQQKYEVMTDREKKSAFIGLLFLIFCFYYFLMSGLLESVNVKAETLKKTQKLLSHLQVISPQIETLRKNSVERAAISGAAQALGVIQTQLEQTGLLAFKQNLQQGGDNNIQLKLNAVSFNQYLDFIDKLSSQYQIGIRQFKMIPSNNPGEVNADVEFEF